MGEAETRGGLVKLTVRRMAGHGGPMEVPGLARLRSGRPTALAVLAVVAIVSCGSNRPQGASQVAALRIVLAGGDRLVINSVIQQL